MRNSKRLITTISVVLVLSIVMTAIMFASGIPSMAWFGSQESSSEPEPKGLPISQMNTGALTLTESLYGSGEVTLLVGASSIQNDLYITLYRENRLSVTGTAFVVVLEDSDGEQTQYTDEDRDGKLYLEELKAGEYLLSVVPMEGFVMPEPKAVTVKAKIEYEVVEDIEAKITDESKVDAKAEDAGYLGKSKEEEVVSSASSSSSSSSSSSGGELLVDTVDFVFSTETVQRNTEYVTKVYYKPVTDRNGYLMLSSTAAAAALSGESLSSGLPGESAPGERSAVSGVSGSSDSSDASSGTGSGLIPICTGEGYLVYARDGQGNRVEVLDGDGNPLTDQNGNPLYEMVRVEIVDEVETIIGVTYTGWQTIDGKTYYYTRDGVAVTGYQVIQGKAYQFDAKGVMTESYVTSSQPTPTGERTLGIDVSSWQGSINWAKVKASGVSFVMIRVGYRGYSSGALIEDSKFYQNISGAAAAGLKVGVYLYSQAINEREAIEEASMAISMVRGYHLAYPIAIDVEFAANTARANNLSVQERTAICRAFCETVRSAGYGAMVYSNRNWLLEKIDVSQLSGYKIWLAHYTTATNYPYRYDIWQYSAKGKVDGISGDVDMNYSYMG